MTAEFKFIPLQFHRALKDYQGRHRRFGKL